MTEKQKAALEKIILALPAEYRESYRVIAEHAISLGYMPALKGVRQDYVDFTSSRVKRTLMKIMADPKSRPCLQLKFYALPAYTPYFQQAVANRAATWERLGYTYRCFGCGKCDGTEGYRLTLADGSPGFICGFGLLPLPLSEADHIEEILDAMTQQHAFFCCTKTDLSTTINGGITHETLRRTAGPWPHRPDDPRGRNTPAAGHPKNHLLHRL